MTTPALNTVPTGTTFTTPLTATPAQAALSRSYALSNGFGNSFRNSVALTGTPLATVGGTFGGYSRYGYGYPGFRGSTLGLSYATQPQFVQTAIAAPAPVVIPQQNPMIVSQQVGLPTPLAPVNPNPDVLTKSPVNRINPNVNTVVQNSHAPELTAIPRTRVFVDATFAQTKVFQPSTRPPVTASPDIRAPTEPLVAPQTFVEPVPQFTQVVTAPVVAPVVAQSGVYQNANVAEALRASNARQSAEFTRQLQASQAFGAFHPGVSYGYPGYTTGFSGYGGFVHPGFVQPNVVLANQRVVDNSTIAPVFTTAPVPAVTRPAYQGRIIGKNWQPPVPMYTVPLTGGFGAQTGTTGGDAGAGVVINTESEVVPQ